MSIDFLERLKKLDSQLAKCLQLEDARQQTNLEMIASESV